MKRRTAFAKSDDTVSLRCPDCGETASRPLDSPDAASLVYDCPCGSRTEFVVERRRTVRQDVNINGFYRVEGGRYTSMTIKDLSRAGIGFEVPEDHSIKKGDHLHVEFCLDDPRSTEIKKEVVVRTIKGSWVGTEFFSQDPKSRVDRVYEMALAFYSLKLSTRPPPKSPTG